MDNTTEMKAVAQQTKENVEALAKQGKENIVEAKDNVKGDVNQLVDQTKSTLDQGIDGAQQQMKTAIEDSKDAISKTKNAVQDSIDNPSSLVSDEIKAEAAEVKGNIEATAGKVKSQVKTSLEQAKDAPSETIKGVTRQMADASGEISQASAEALQRRLDWGEPALTIIDVRHRDSFNQERIRGAISMPEADLVSNAPKSLEYDRELFIYGETTLQADQSVVSLQQAGFSKVASISGGMTAWQSAGGATEGIAA